VNSAMYANNVPLATELKVASQTGPDKLANPVKTKNTSSNWTSNLWRISNIGVRSRSVTAAVFLVSFY